MVDGRVEQEVALVIVNNLVYFDYPSTVLAGLDSNRLDMRIEVGELTCPVSANLIFPMDVATFKTVRPFHLWIHARDYRIDVTGIEIPVGASKDFTLVGHAG
ncbi:MAG: hypothetical protein WB561_18715 [Terracidiphilus sp.]